ncbi:unnamed protein product [Trichogramma brassicae]|uniref:Uncharacterized protein n=1 Tax=Trichogramma brassicae TaxID=86971 RepID=A0A6H5I0N6_9HYME|nr:unnamed protein product [Trichogramma brassicae]
MRSSAHFFAIAASGAYVNQSIERRFNNIQRRKFNEPVMSRSRHHHVHESLQPQAQHDPPGAGSLPRAGATQADTSQRERHLVVERRLQGQHRLPEHELSGQHELPQQPGHSPVGQKVIIRPTTTSWPSSRKYTSEKEIFLHSSTICIVHVSRSPYTIVAMRIFRSCVTAAAATGCIGLDTPMRRFANDRIHRCTSRKQKGSRRGSIVIRKEE